MKRKASATLRVELNAAIERYAGALSEAKWTNGYRTAYEARGQAFINNPESARLFTKENAQWERAGECQHVVKRILRAFLSARTRETRMFG